MRGGGARVSDGAARATDAFAPVVTRERTSPLPDGLHAYMQAGQFGSNETIIFPAMSFSWHAMPPSVAPSCA